MLGPNRLSEPGSQAGFDPEMDASSKPTYSACAGPTVATIPGLHGATCPRSPLQDRCPLGEQVPPAAAGLMGPTAGGSVAQQPDRPGGSGCSGSEGWPTA